MSAVYIVPWISAKAADVFAKMYSQAVQCTEFNNVIFMLVNDGILFYKIPGISMLHLTLSAGRLRYRSIIERGPDSRM